MVSRAQKISTVVDVKSSFSYPTVSRAQKISTVVDGEPVHTNSAVSRAQKISTVVDCLRRILGSLFHALKKFLLL